MYQNNKLTKYNELTDENKALMDKMTIKDLNNLRLAAIDNPNNKYYVTEIGTKLAGRSVEQMKDLFTRMNNKFGIPDNIILPQVFEVRTTQQETLVSEVKTILPQYGVVQASTNPTKEFDNKLVSAISNNIMKNAYVENGSSTANLMFSYGWQWKGNNTKNVTGEKLKVQPAQVDFNATGKLQPIKPYYFYDSKYNDGTPVPNIKELDFLKDI